MGLVKQFRIKSHKRPNSIISFENINLSYGSRLILDNINFKINEGQIFGMLGPNGVGKSTITNLLLSSHQLKTKSLSSKSNKGRHTTTTTSMYKINTNSYLIDTPGVENLHPAIKDIQDIQHGFKEMKIHLGRCKYNDWR